MTEKSNKSRQTLSRKLPSRDSAGLAEHVRLVGEVIWAWNELHRAFAFCFVFLVETPIAYAIWAVQASENAQREMLKEVVHLSLSPSGGHSKGLLWALRETEELCRFRNDIVHGFMTWELTPKGRKPKLGYFGNRLNALLRYADWETEEGEFREGPDLQKGMGLLRGDLMQLSRYVSELSRGRAAKPSPLPRRPRLQCRKYFRERGFRLRAPPKRRTRPKAFPK